MPTLRSNPAARPVASSLSPASAPPSAGSDRAASSGPPVAPPISIFLEAAPPGWTRRRFLHRSVWASSTLPFLAGCQALRPGRARVELATFSADVTVPLGHPLMGGGIAPSREIVDPLLARGFVLFGDGLPVVVAVVDWCEICNDAYAR